MALSKMTMQSHRRQCRRYTILQWPCCVPFCFYNCFVDVFVTLINRAHSINYGQTCNVVCLWPFVRVFLACFSLDYLFKVTHTRLSFQNVRPSRRRSSLLINMFLLSILCCPFLFLKFYFIAFTSISRNDLFSLTFQNN